MHVYITILSGLNQPTAFGANILQSEVYPGTQQHLR